MERSELEVRVDPPPLPDNHNLHLQHYEQTVQKYKELEVKFFKLKKLAHKAVSDHEDLLTKYQENQRVTSTLREKLVEANNKIAQLQEVLEPAFNEYNDLEAKLETETKCRLHAEHYATKMVKSYKTLKRKTVELSGRFNFTDISFDDEDDTSNTNGENNLPVAPIEDRKQEQEIIQKLKDEISDLTSRLQHSQEEKDTALAQRNSLYDKYEKKNISTLRLQKCLSVHEKTLAHFQNVSERALHDYNELKEKYEIERQCRAKAMNFAQQKLKERDVMARESQLVLESAGNDEALAKAMIDIENLSKELEEQKYQQKQKEAEYEELLSCSTDVARLGELEEQIAAFREQTELQQLRLQSAEERVIDLERENDELRSKLTDAEERLKPPPPPPLPPTGFFKSIKPLQDLIKKKKDRKGNPAPQTPSPLNESYDSVLSDMMKRIKSGKPILKTKGDTPTIERRPSEPSGASDNSAMADMHRILVSLKKRSLSLGDMMEDIPMVDTNVPEFILRKKSLKRTGTLDLTPEDECDSIAETETTSSSATEQSTALTASGTTEV